MLAVAILDLPTSRAWQRQPKAWRPKSNSANQNASYVNMFNIPYRPYMVYLHIFTYTWIVDFYGVWINIPYMDGMSTEPLIFACPS